MRDRRTEGALMVEERVLQILTEQQREVYLLRQDGMTCKEIAEKINAPASRVTSCLKHAKRKIAEYESYHATGTSNDAPLDFPMTAGELRLVLEGLDLLKRDMESDVHRRLGTDWQGCLPYSYQIADDLTVRLLDAFRKNET